MSAHGRFPPENAASAPPNPAPVPLAIAGSAALIVAVLVEVFEVMLLPRRVRRRLRFVRAYFRGTWRVWRAVAGAAPRRWRAELLAGYGPLAMVGLLSVWTTALVTGFGCLQWSLHRDVPEPPTLLNQLYFSGVTFFTLGYGDVTAATRAGKVASVLEAGIGFGFIAVAIGYLPVLYQLFSRREAHVIRLDARAGSPPTAVALLERHAGAQGMTALGALLADWESWAAELLESHLSYPMLAYYRSQHDNESWLAALTAVTDASALIMVGLERVGAHANGDGARDHPGGRDDVPRFQARMTFAGARLAAVEMARVLADTPSNAPAGAPTAGAATRPSADRLPPAAFAALSARLADAGLRFADPAGAGQALGRARAAYEPQLAALAARLRLPLPPWARAPDAPDNWEQDAPAARRLYEEAEAREVDAAGPRRAHGTGRGA